MSDNEKSGRGGSIRDMPEFQIFVSNLELINLPLSGRRFTWSNNRISPILAKLGRFFVSSDLESLFPNLIQFTYPNVCSNHCPVILNFDGILNLFLLSDLRKFGFVMSHFLPLSKTTGLLSLSLVMGFLSLPPN